MKKIFFFAVLSCVSFLSQAANTTTVYVCTLRPFSTIFADVGLTEDIARYKVSQRCNNAQSGSMDSIFCQPKKANCTVSSLLVGNNNGGFNNSYGNNNSGVQLFSRDNLKGKSVSLSSSVRDLAFLGFDNQMSSFLVPSGWVVRFYTGKDFTGKFYTREGGFANAGVQFDKRISSVQILRTS